MRTDRKVMVDSLAALSVAAIFCVPATKAQGQARGPDVVSAKAGGINAMSGSVMVMRQGTEAAQTVSLHDNLASGDRLTTGADGRGEVLLNPGSYLRLAENSELELTDASLDSLRLKLLGGSALVEVMSARETLPPIEVRTPHTKIVIPRRGLYRVDVTDWSATLVRVRKGRAIVGESALTEVKEGMEVTVDPSGAVNVAEFDRKLQDPFDLWSGQRAEMLAGTNTRLSPGMAAGAYSRHRSSLYEWRSLDGYWIYDPFFSGYTFLPYSGGWSSPYGPGYGISFGSRSDATGLYGYGRGYRIGNRRPGWSGSIIQWSHWGGHHSLGHHHGGHHGGRRH